MDPLQFATALNEQGASALSANNTLSAFEFFRASLQTMLVGVPQSADILKSCAPLEQSSKSLLMHPWFYHRALWPVASVLTAQQQQQLQAAADPRIFTKAFDFQHREDSEQSLAGRTRTLLAILFFNLAATVHQQSVCLSKREHALRTALVLYDVGFDLLIQEESCCVDDLSTNISLAILNNMAEVHWALSDFSKASRVLELQKSLLDIIFSNKQPHSFSEEEMELFILNTHLLQAPSGAAAA